MSSLSTGHVVSTQPWPVVYRAYDADDRLLYVGQTVNYERRMRCHVNQSWWFALTARIDAEIQPSLEAARQREIEVIGSETPAFNQQHAGASGRQPWELTPQEVEVCRAWIEGDRKRIGFLPNRLFWVLDEQVAA